MELACFPFKNFNGLFSEWVLSDLKTLSILSFRKNIENLEVVIIASDGLHNTEWKKNIPIADINDNAPRFLTPEFSFDIFENVERGAFVGKIEAEDFDDNEKITYSFISDWGLDTFSIGK